MNDVLPAGDHLRLPCFNEPHSSELYLFEKVSAACQKDLSLISSQYKNSTSFHEGSKFVAARKLINIKHEELTLLSGICYVN